MAAIELIRKLFPNGKALYVIYMKITKNVIKAAIGGFCRYPRKFRILEGCVRLKVSQVTPIKIKISEYSLKPG